MANLRAIYGPGVSGTYFRGINAAGQYWSVDGSAFEAYDDTNALAGDYDIAATETVTGSCIYQAAVPAEWLDGTFTYLYFDPASSTDPLSSEDITLNNAGDEITPLNISVDVVDINDVTPVYVQLGTGEVFWQEIKANQFTAFGPYTFFLFDSQKPPSQQPINLEGHDIVFVCSDQDGTYRWQIDNCTVLGTYSNIVKVEGDDTNTAEAGNFRYALRDLTTDKVIARGRLIIEVDADSE